MTRQERYEKMKKDQERQKAQEQFSGEKPEIPMYLPLEKDKFALFRIVSEPYASATKGTDGTRIKQSMIRGDDGKYFNVVWSYERDWPLNQFYYEMTKGNYDQETKTKTFDKQGCEILKAVTTNGQTDNPYATGWKPREFVLLNVIDRLDMDWHRATKKCKVLTKDASKNDEGEFYPSYGISKGGVYPALLDVCEDSEFHFKDSDLALRRYSQKKNDKWYKALSPEFQMRTLEKYEKEDGVEYCKYASDQPLTEEELSWEMFDFRDATIYRTTPTARIYNHIKKTIKAADEKYGFNYDEIFKDAIAVEKAEWLARKEQEEKKKAVTKTKEVPEKKESSPIEEEEKNQDVEEEKVKTRSRKKKEEKTEDSSLSQEDVPSKYEEAYDLLTDKEKSMIVDFDREKDTFVYEGYDPEEGIGNCPECDKLSPMEFGGCPYCGEEF